MNDKQKIKLIERMQEMDNDNLGKPVWANQIGEAIAWILFEKRLQYDKTSRIEKVKAVEFAAVNEVFKNLADTKCIIITGANMNICEIQDKIRYYPLKW